MKEVIEWFKKVPKAEIGMPFLVYKGKVYTPSDIVQLAKQNKLPDDLKKKVLSHQFTTILDKYIIGIERVRKVLKNLQSKGKDIQIAIGGKIYTPKQLLKEVETGSKIGRILVEAEIDKWEILWKKKKENK